MHYPHFLNLVPFAPKRRWFQFRLRTMFVVVTLFGCWLGYELNWIRQRRSLLNEQNVINQEIAQWAQPTLDYTLTFTGVSVPPRAPTLLWLFGEQGVAGLSLVFIEKDPMHPVDAAQKKRIGHSLFPEAALIDVKVVRAPLASATH